MITTKYINVVNGLIELNIDNTPFFAKVPAIIAKTYTNKAETLT